MVLSFVCSRSQHNDRQWLRIVSATISILRPPRQETMPLESRPRSDKIPLDDASALTLNSPSVQPCDNSFRWTYVSIIVEGDTEIPHKKVDMLRTCAASLKMGGVSPQPAELKNSIGRRRSDSGSQTNTTSAGHTLREGALRWAKT